MNERMQQQADLEYQRQQAELERQLRQQEQLARERVQRQRAGAPVDPLLIGTWKLSNQQSPFVGGPKSMELSLNEDATYLMNEDGKQSTGKARAWNSQLTLTPSSGSEREFFYRHLFGRSFVPGRPAKATLQLITRQSSPIMLEKE